MSELVERAFPAKSLLNGIRSIGYSFSTAVADIIDNSISAGASEIKIYSNSNSDAPYFCIIDNGHGMDSIALDNAMLPGSNRDNVEDSELELGRFGLGLKSASLSQCRQFTVASKTNGIVSAMSFDLDIIEKTNKLMLQCLNSEEIFRLPQIEKLDCYKNGTIVIWEKFDRIEDTAKSFDDSFRSLVSESKRHTELVFHRFYNEISIFYNEKRIEKRDPFLLASHGRQQTGRESSIKVDNSVIQVIPYTLPFANTLTEEEKNLLGNPKSVYDEQGFYLYRNKRLISWGSWMHMGVKSELNKLARIQIDIPSSLDSVWTLDVKKSSAKIPDKIKEQIRISLKDSITRSKRTTKSPGIKEQQPEHKVWDRIVDEHNNIVKYQINRDIPALKALEDSIGDNEKSLLDIVLSQIESYLPKYSIVNDNTDEINIANSGEDSEDEQLISEIEKTILMVNPDKKRDMFNMLFLMEMYHSLLPRKEEIMRRLFEDE